MRAAIAIAGGASAAGPAVLWQWATGSHPLEMEVLAALEQAGQDCAQSMADSPKDAGHPLYAAAESRSPRKIGALMDRARSAEDLLPLVDCWLRGRVLRDDELAVFEQALARGARAPAEAIAASVAFLED